MYISVLGLNVYKSIHACTEIYHEVHKQSNTLYILNPPDQQVLNNSIYLNQKFYISELFICRGALSGIHILRSSTFSYIAIYTTTQSTVIQIY